MTTWPDMHFPPINLYNAPARGKDAIVTDTSKMTFNELAECVTALEDELYDTKQKLELSRKRVADAETVIKVFRGCVDVQLLPATDSPCYKLIVSMVGESE